jgi:hypothetical protein
MAEQGHRRGRRWPLVFLLALATVSLLLHATELLRRREVAGLARRHAAQVRQRPIAATKQRRARYYMGRFFLGYPQAASYAVADLARRLAAAARPMRLLSIQVDPGLHDLAFALAVDLGEQAPRAPRRRIDALVRRLKRIPWVLQAEPAPGPGGAPAAGNVFFVSGRAEMP